MDTPLQWGDLLRWAELNLTYWGEDEILMPNTVPWSDVVAMEADAPTPSPIAWSGDLLPEPGAYPPIADPSAAVDGDQWPADKPIEAGKDAGCARAWLTEYPRVADLNLVVGGERLRLGKLVETDEGVDLIRSWVAVFAETVVYLSYKRSPEATAFVFVSKGPDLTPYVARCFSDPARAPTFHRLRGRQMYSLVFSTVWAEAFVAANKLCFLGDMTPYIGLHRIPSLTMYRWYEDTSGAVQYSLTAADGKYELWRHCDLVAEQMPQYLADFHGIWLMPPPKEPKKKKR